MKEQTQGNPKGRLATWSLIGLVVAMAAAVGGGLYEHVVLMPLWSAAPPASFAVIQPGTGVPLQRFWMPVHGVITLLVIVALIASWRDVRVRKLLLLGLASYIVMRTWSGLLFIPEMLAFQQIPLDAPASAELLARVQRWTTWSWFREPLDLVSLICFALAFAWRVRSAGAAAPPLVAAALPREALARS